MRRRARSFHIYGSSRVNTADWGLYLWDMVFLGVSGQKRGLEKFAKHSVGIGLEKIRNESLQQNLTGDIIFVHVPYVFVKL